MNFELSEEPRLISGQRRELCDEFRIPVVDRIGEEGAGVTYLPSVIAPVSSEMGKNHIATHVRTLPRP